MNRTNGSAERADVYSRITGEIISAIEAGAGDWRMPWHHDGTAVTRPENIASSRRYRGVNVLALCIPCAEQCSVPRYAIRLDDVRA